MKKHACLGLVAKARRHRTNARLIHKTGAPFRDRIRVRYAGCFIIDQELEGRLKRLSGTVLSPRGLTADPA